jgi:hypothetical protein
MHSLRFLLPLVSALLIATLGLAQPSQPTAPSPQITNILLFSLSHAHSLMGHRSVDL